MCTTIVLRVSVVLCMDLQLGTAIVLCVKLVQCRCKYQGHSVFQLFLSSIVKRFLSSIVKRFLSSIVKNFSARIHHVSLPKTSCVKIFNSLLSKHFSPRGSFLVHE